MTTTKLNSHAIRKHPAGVIAAVLTKHPDTNDRAFAAEPTREFFMADAEHAACSYGQLVLVHPEWGVYGPADLFGPVIVLRADERQELIRRLRDSGYTVEES